MKKIAKLVNHGMPVSPCYIHDCGRCVFLGRLNGEDLYRCENDGSYVRRFGARPDSCGSLGEITPEGTPYALAARLWADRQAAHQRWIAWHPHAYEA